MIINGKEYTCKNCPHARETEMSGSYARQYYRCCNIDGKEKLVFDEPCKLRLEEISMIKN